MQTGEECCYNRGIGERHAKDAPALWNKLPYNIRDTSGSVFVKIQIYVKNPPF